MFGCALLIYDSLVIETDLAAGHSVLICNRPAHYKNGMYADFTVTP